MKTYRYQELKLQTCRWVEQGYRNYLWQAQLREELPDEGKYAADSDLEEPDTEGDFSYKDKTRSQTGWRAWIYRHRWSPIQTNRLLLLFFTK